MGRSVYFGQMNRKPAPLYAENRIRELRKQREMTMEELGARVGQILRGDDLAISTVRKLETRTMGLTLDYILAISQVLEVEPTELIVGSRGRGKHVPLVGRIAAGKWKEAVEDFEQLVPIPDGICGPNAFALRPDGDSMDRLVGEDAGEDSFIVVDPDERDLLDGKAYAVSNSDGETTFKRFRSTPPRLEPCSRNEEHKPIIIGHEPFTIIGRVVYSGRLL